MKKTRIFFLILAFFPVLCRRNLWNIKSDDGKPLPGKVVQIKQNELVMATDTTDATTSSQLQLRK